ncbi:MAG TPA: HPF/RaiA family ribosome-associated protein [Candidatus Paceibacterota bacterium]
MNIQFKNSDGSLSPALQEHVEGKLVKLAKLTDTTEHSANAVFSLERSVGSHQSGDVWEAAITIDVLGDRFYTSELAEFPEKAAEKVLKEIRIELKKAKGKRQALTKREGGFWKRMQQRFTKS